MTQFTADTLNQILLKTGHQSLDDLLNQPMTLPDLYIAPLPNYTVVTVSGSDATQFLQNQFSNQINDVTVTHAQLSSYSSAKGMMYGNFRVLFDSENYLLRLNTDSYQALIKRLSLFILREDVTLTPPKEQNSDAYLAFGIAGEQAEKVLQTLNLPIPAQVDDVVSHNQILITRCIHRQSLPRFEVYSPIQPAIELLTQAKEKNIDIASPQAYLSQQLQDGEAIINQTSYEQFVAQMLNLELINGVNFKKGCYPGQEYIARTQYRGQIRSRTFCVRCDIPLEEGQDIFSQETSSSIGTILNVSQSTQGTVATAVIRLKYAQTPLYVTTQAGEQAALNTQALAYEVPFEKEEK